MAIFWVGGPRARWGIGLHRLKRKRTIYEKDKLESSQTGHFLIQLFFVQPRDHFQTFLKARHEFIHETFKLQNQES